jgi:heterodisulfide reductase subunit B
MNLEAYQRNVNKKYGTAYAMPILFFTQILGVALGLSIRELGIEKNFYRCARLEELAHTTVSEDALA